MRLAAFKPSVPRRQRTAAALRGRDGWLFLAGDRNNVLGQHTGRARLGRRRQAAWKRLLRVRAADMEARGVTWLTLVAPDKEAVYADFLPPEVVPAERRPIHELLEIADSVGSPMRYPLGAMRAARSQDHRPLYFQTDTHWNQLGAFIAYCTICDDLVQRGFTVSRVTSDEVRWTEATFTGDLGEKLDPTVSGMTVRADLRKHTSRLVSDNQVANHGRRVIFESPGARGPTCVLFGESFAMQLLMFLKESFRRLVFVHTNMLDRTVIDREAADVVLSIPVERFLMEVPDDAGAAAKLAGTAQRKLAEGRTRAFLPGIPEAA